VIDGFSATSQEFQGIFELQTVTLPYKGALCLVRRRDEGDTVGVVQMLRGSMVRHRGIRRSGLALLAVGVVPLGLSACGSSSANGASTSTTKPSGTASETAYVACLKKNGVTLPNFGHGAGGTPAGGGTRPSFTPGSGTFTPGANGGGFANNPKFAKAAAACKNLRPKGGFGGFGGSGGFNSTAFAAYRNCLKLHGVTLPTGGGRPSPGSTPSTTTPSASYQAAIAACAALRPTPSTTTTTG
jgi:hypothetical protein